MPLGLPQGHSLSVRTNVFVAERREPPGEYPSDLTTVTGQLALFRYKVNALGFTPGDRYLHARAKVKLPLA